MADPSKLPELPAGVEIRPEGQGEERRVVLDIEKTTFEWHPEEAISIGENLIAAGKAAREHENG